MWYIVSGTLLVLLILSVVLLTKPEEEDGFWGRLVLYYLTFMFSLNLGFLKMPLLILIGFGRLNGQKPHLNKIPKSLALIFALVAFISNHYVLPTVSYGHLGLSRQVYTAMEKFSEVKSVHVFSPDSPIQDTLRVFGDEDTPDTLVTVFVLQQENMETENLAQDRKYYLFDELRTKYYWNWSMRSIQSQAHECHMTIFNRKHGQVDYYAIIDTSDGQLYLKYVVRGRLRSGAWPRFPF